MSKHTPGPWKTKELMVYAEDGNGVTIASVNSEANARLIAAVPELLESLIEAESYIDEVLRSEKRNHGSNCASDLELKSQLSAAIAKATG